MEALNSSSKRGGVAESEEKQAPRALNLTNLPLALYKKLDQRKSEGFKSKFIIKIQLTLKKIYLYKSDKFIENSVSFQNLGKINDHLAVGSSFILLDRQSSLVLSLSVSLAQKDKESFSAPTSCPTPFLIIILSYQHPKTATKYPRTCPFHSSYANSVPTSRRH